MTNITYMPTEHDNDETDVAGIHFKPYEPVDVPNHREELVEKLKNNAWFTDGEPDPERKKCWELVRHAQKQAKAHRELANKIENDPSILNIPPATAELIAADIGATPSLLN